MERRRKEGREREKKKEKTKEEVEKGNSHSTRFMHTPPPRAELFLPGKSATLKLRQYGAWQQSLFTVVSCFPLSSLHASVFKFTLDLESGLRDKLFAFREIVLKGGFFKSGSEVNGKWARWKLNRCFEVFGKDQYAEEKRLNKNIGNQIL